MAADHRAASQALRDAEGRACAGLSDADRDESPFHHRDDIASVETLSEGSGSRGPAHVVGAIVSTALGHEMPEMPYCPLVPKGSAKVTSVWSAHALTQKLRGGAGLA